MEKIKKLRNEIEKLHEDLLTFILKRKDLVDQIWKVKGESNIEIIDLERELFLIHQFDKHPQLSQDEHLRDLYHDVVKSIIAKNKAYAKKTQTR